MRNSQILILLSLFFSASLWSQETVFVKGDENGNGFSRSRYGKCYVITPNHVVASSGSINIINKKRLKLKGRLIESFEPDLAVLEIEDSEGFNCEEWELNTNTATALDNSSTGFIDYKDEFGTTNYFHVNITSMDDSSISIIPQNSDTFFSKGMSGSSLYVNYKGDKVLMGMLISLENDLKTGYVYQIDDIFRVLEPFFKVEENSTEIVQDPLCKENNTGDYCFTNTRDQKLVIQLNYYRNSKEKYPHGYKTFTINPNESKCVYGLLAKPMLYYITTQEAFYDDSKFRGYEYLLKAPNRSKFLLEKGELNIQACQTNTYIIK